MSGEDDEKASKISASEIKMKLALAKLLYFATSMGNVGWNRFQNLYFLGNGIHPKQIGQLKSLGLFLKLFGEPFWCFIADYTDPKFVFVICLLTQILSMEILSNWVPLTLTVIIVVKIIRIATAPATTLTTMASFKLTEGSKEGFGQQRLFGSIAWGVGAFVVGSLIDSFGMSSMFYFTYFFQSVSLLIVWGVLPSTLPSEPKKYASDLLENGGVKPSLEDDEIYDNIKSDKCNKKISSLSGIINFSCRSYGNVLYENLSNFIFELKQFLNNRCCRFILLNSLIMGIVMQTLETYLFIYLQENFNATKSFSGLCTTIGSWSCVPIFYYSASLVEKYGHGNMIFVSSAIMLLRLMLLMILPTTWKYTLNTILVMHLLHGPSFALFWATSVDAIFKQSPKNLSTSCMATLNLFYNVIGACIGSLFWGYMYEILGGMTHSFFLISILIQIISVRYCYLSRVWFDVVDDKKNVLHQSGKEDFIAKDTHRYNGTSIVKSIGAMSMAHVRAPHRKESL